MANGNFVFGKAFEAMIEEGKDDESVSGETTE